MQLPSLPVAALADKFAPEGISIETAKDGLLVLRRESDGKAYPLQVYDGHILGTQLFYACKRFAIDPYELVYR